MCSIYALPTAKSLKIKFINGFLRDVPPKFNFRNKNWLRAKLTFPLSDIIVSNTKSGLLAYKAPLAKGKCIYNGFDFHRIDKIKQNHDIKRKLEIKTKYTVGMVASFTENKDHLTFVKSALEILKKREDISFILVGDGHLSNYYYNLIKDKHETKFRFLGKIHNVEEIINACDIGILTTNVNIHGEGISNSLLEFMALRKPVIATRCSGNLELISNGINGYLADPFDPYEIADKILLLIDNKNLYNQIAGQAQYSVRNSFNIETMTSRYIKLYEQISA
jgi:glycosyltransferase involved in cell wall biosynthesis